MKDYSKLQNPLMSQILSPLLLMELPEVDLMRLLHRLARLQTELQCIPLLNEKIVEAVNTTQDLLDMCKHILERSFDAKQVQDTNVQLARWDNEGGTVSYIPV